MKHSISIILYVFIVSFSGTSKVLSLTLQDFQTICESVEVCSEHPILQAYVGGALDLIATLDSDTDYLAPIYCDEPSDIFNVEKIINYMQRDQRNATKENAMLSVIRYFEDHGGC